ncbi:cytochrome P450 2C5-like [Amphiura filiformis]|uniref:cytochrome P450 2C5-like n=1 Tax=Amphiura filiformis TaxID=82378 RepID=UPI003B220334
MANLQTLFSYMARGLDIRTILLGLIVFLVLSWIVSSYRNQVQNLPPGPMAWPLIGCLPQLLFMCFKTKSIDHIKSHLCETYGPVCNVPLPFGINVVLVSGYNAVNELFRSPQFDQRVPVPRLDLPEEVLNGAGVLLSVGELWQEHRRFSMTVLRSFGVGKRSFEDQIATETEYLMKEISSTQSNPFDPSLLLSNATSNIICSVVIGKRFEYDDPELKDLLHSVEEILRHSAITISFVFAPKLVYYLTMIPFLPKGPLPFMISVRRKLHEIVIEHRDTFDSENLRDYIDVYLNDMQMKLGQELPTHFSDVELRAVIGDFFGAGTETTATTLRWALLYMLKYPAVQKKVHEELDSVIGRDRLPKMSDKPNLPCTVAVIHEIQRFASIFLPFLRYANQDVAEFQGFAIPKGSYMQASLYSVSRDASIWRDPDEFKPERFLDERGNVIKIPENMAFGAGKRVCLGEQLARMELFLFYTHLMHRYTIKKPAGMDIVNIQKKYKYQDLVADCENRGRCTHYFPIEMGSRGIYNTSLTKCIAALGVPGGKGRNIMDVAYKTALSILEEFRQTDLIQSWKPSPIEVKEDVPAQDTQT